MTTLAVVPTATRRQSRFSFAGEVPTEVKVAVTSFKVSVVLTPADALAVAGELLTAAPAQMKNKT
jgi:hypothetical protein